MKPAGNRFDVAVFPLLNAVLFPGTTLPLHIFEPRYSQMLRDVQSRGWPLAVSLVVPHTPTELLLNTVCGAGDVEVFKDYGDGRFDILVHGRRRVKLHHFVQQQPYFIMEAESIRLPDLQAVPEERRRFEEFRDLIKTWVFLNPDVEDEFSMIFEEFKTFSELSDFFVFHFMKRAPDKQVYLNCLNPLERAEMLTNFLMTDVARMSRKVSRHRRALTMH